MDNDETVMVELPRAIVEAAQAIARMGVAVARGDDPGEYPDPATAIASVVRAQCQEMAMLKAAGEARRATLN